MRLNVQEAARLLNVSTKTIYRWVSDGRLPGYRLQKQYRFDRAELLEWATAQRIAVTPDLGPEVTQRAEVPIPTFAAALEHGSIYYRMNGTTRDEVLRAVVSAARLVEPSDRDLLSEALIARENLASTAVGDGFAVPHLRNPLRLQIKEPTVTLCFLEQPVDWLAPDGQPVSVLFVVVGPTVRSVLRLQSQTWFALRDERFREVVRGHGSREAILSEAARVSASLRAPGEAP